MSKNLPAMRSVLKSIFFTIKNFGTLLKISLVWLIICAVFNVLLELLDVGEYLAQLRSLDLLSPQILDYNGSANQNADVQDLLDKIQYELEIKRAILGGLIPIHQWGNYLIQALAFSSFAIIWVRVYLLAEKPPYFRFGKFELRFFLYFLGFCAVFVALFLAVWFVFVDKQATDTGLGFIAILIGFVMLLLASRFLLVFPGVAVGDKRMNPLSSWHYTKNNSLDMYGGVLLVAFATIPLQIIKALFGSSGYSIYVNAPIQLFLSLIFLAMLMSFLSIAYQFFVPRPQAGDLV